MKLFKRIVAAVAALTILSSCSVLKNVAANATSLGSSTGSALASIFKVLKSTGGIDLSNLTNIINLGQILTGANSLTGATSSFTDQFASGLINGSSNLVNSSNVSSVLGGLKSLANIDTSAISSAAAAASAGKTAEINYSTEGVSATVNTLKNILGALK